MGISQSDKHMDTQMNTIITLPCFEQVWGKAITHVGKLIIVGIDLN